MQWLEDKKVPYLLTKELIRNDATQRNKALNEYYIPNDGHPTPYQNLIVANELKRVIMKRRLALRDE